MDQQVYISCSSLDLWVPWSKMAQQEYEKRGLLHFYEQLAKAKVQKKADAGWLVAHSYNGIAAATPSELGGGK